MLRYHFELGGGKENYFSRCKEGGEEKEHLLHEGEGGEEGGIFLPLVLCRRMYGIIAE